MTTADLIQSLCFKSRYLKELQEKQKESMDIARGRLIISVKAQIWNLKREYREARIKAKGMAYEYNGRFFLATREITGTEFSQYRKMQSLKVA